MDELRLEAVAASVAAWHNRQPLACRIGLKQVLSVGVVRLPFVTAAGSPPRPAFSENFLPPWSARRIGRWAARHGQRFDGELADEVARRDVAADPALVKAGDKVVTFIVRTAVVDVNGRQRRVLLGPGARPAVLGRALMHRPRLALLGAVVLAASAAIGVLVQLPPRGGAADAAVPVWTAASAAAEFAAAAAASAAGASELKSALAPAPASSAEAAASAAVAAGPAVALAVAAAASVAEATATPPSPPPPPASAPLPVAPHERPPDAAPRWGRIDLPARPAIVARPQTPLFGIASSVLRTEGESERVQGLMQRLLEKAGTRGVQVERLQVGADWRIVGYPFRSRDDAERGALALLKGGLRTEVVDF